MKLHCLTCGKPVSTEIPSTSIVRAVIECPECYEKCEEATVALLAEVKHALAHPLTQACPPLSQLKVWVERYETEHLPAS